MNAARSRDATYQRHRKQLLEAGRIYFPPSNGLHVCGSDDTHNAAITLGCWPMNPADAERLFAECKQLFGDSEGHDVILDLFLGDGVDQACGMRRQMIEPMKRFLAERGFLDVRRD